MPTETSVIARKLQNFYVIENDGKSTKKTSEKKHGKQEPGYLVNMVLIGLMGLAIVFTQMSLYMVKAVQAIEERYR